MVTPTPRSLLAALAAPEIALIAAVAAATAYAAHLPLILLPGALACGACALLRRDRRAPEPPLLRRCRARCADCLALIEAFPPAERALLRDADADVRALLASAERLTRQLDDEAAEARGAEDLKNAPTSLAALHARRAATLDPVAGALLDEAIAQRAAQDTAVAALATRRDRLASELLAVEAALAATAARLRAARAAATTLTGPAVAEILRSLRTPADKAAAVSAAFEEAKETS